MKKVIVDRETWFRGQGSPQSQLLRDDGMRCCIGFACAQLGVPDEKILGIASVNRIDETLVIPCLRSLPGRPHGLREDEWVGLAYPINDSHRITDAEREAKLIELGKINGIEFEFTN